VNAMSIQIEARHRLIVEKILGDLRDCVAVFGSRAKGTAKTFSDLDLVIRGLISRDELSRLRELFEDSDLPFKVDLVVWNDLDPSFQQQISQDLVPF